MRPAIIVDMDGTLTDGNGRGWYDWPKVSQDLPIQVIVDLVKKYAFSTDIIIVTGRSTEAMEGTELWLLRQGIRAHDILMRLEGDKREDYVVKKELYEEHIKGQYNVLFVLEDRTQCVTMWRSEGLKCLQVAAGDF